MKTPETGDRKPDITLQSLQGFIESKTAPFRTGGAMGRSAREPFTAGDTAALFARGRASKNPYEHLVNLKFHERKALFTAQQVLKEQLYAHFSKNSADAILDQIMTPLERAAEHPLHLAQIRQAMREEN